MMKYYRTLNDKPSQGMEHLPRIRLGRSKDYILILSEISYSGIDELTGLCEFKFRLLNATYLSDYHRSMVGSRR